MSSKIAVISTSIHEKPEAYEQWAEVGDLYVALDLSSPPGLSNFLENIGANGIQPWEQDRWACSNSIGWRNIQRRNAALLEALDAGHYDFIMTVDDDNQIMGSPARFAADMAKTMTDGPAMKIVTVEDGAWFNPGRLGVPSYRQRGLPATYTDDDADWGISSIEYLEDRLGVWQCFIYGDPDTDAVQRIVKPVDVRRYSYDGVVPYRGIYAPFNSQATMWRGDLAPLMAVLPDCMRYDDIYASIIATKILHVRGFFVGFGDPGVHQDRNPHDYGKDLALEVAGMNAIEKFRAVVDAVEIYPGDSIFENYSAVCSSLCENDLISERTHTFTNEFITDVRTTTMGSAL